MDEGYINTLLLDSQPADPQKMTPSFEPKPQPAADESSSGQRMGTIRTSISQMGLSDSVAVQQATSSLYDLMWWDLQFCTLDMDFVKGVFDDYWPGEEFEQIGGPDSRVVLDTVAVVKAKAESAGPGGDTLRKLLRANEETHYFQSALSILNLKAKAMRIKIHRQYWQALRDRVLSFDEETQKQLRSLTHNCEETI